MKKDISKEFEGGAATTGFVPHWFGGMLDWRAKRINTCAPAGAKIEVGEYYVVFIRNLIN